MGGCIFYRTEESPPVMFTKVIFSITRDYKGGKKMPRPTKIVDKPKRKYTKRDQIEKQLIRLETTTIGCRWRQLFFNLISFGVFSFWFVYYFGGSWHFFASFVIKPKRKYTK